MIVTTAIGLTDGTEVELRVTGDSDRASAVMMELLRLLPSAWAVQFVVDLLDDKGSAQVMVDMEEERRDRGGDDVAG